VLNGEKKRGKTKNKIIRKEKRRKVLKK